MCKLKKIVLNFVEVVVDLSVNNFSIEDYRINKLNTE